MSNYYSIAEARVAGITESQLDDTALQLEIDYWEGFIEEITKKKFYARDAVVDVDGSGNAMVKLNHSLAPLNSVETVKVDDSEISSDFWVFYGAIPAIVFTDKVYRNIFAGMTSTFPQDKQNVEISGNFGPTTVPKALKMLMRLILIRAANGEMNDKLKSEKIGDYNYQRFENDGMFNDPQLNMFLKSLMMKADMSVI